MEEKVKVVTLKNELTGAEDRYALGLTPIGEGKSAKVFRAVSMRNPRRVFAVKVIKL
jgi:flagellar motor switch protein FliG